MIFNDRPDIGRLIGLVSLQSIDIVAYLIKQVLGLAGPSPVATSLGILVQVPTLRLIKHLRSRLLLADARPYHGVVWLDEAGTLGVVG